MKLGLGLRLRLVSFEVASKVRAEKLIENFKRNWSELKLTITPKHHLLTNHVLEFCRKFDRTPMVFSEHDIESSHRFFGGLSVGGWWRAIG